MIPSDGTGDGEEGTGGGNQGTGGSGITVTYPTLEELFKLVSHRDDIFYGTNKEVLL
jgi:hypothetical protein